MRKPFDRWPQWISSFQMLFISITRTILIIIIVFLVIIILFLTELVAKVIFVFRGPLLIMITIIIVPLIPSSSNGCWANWIFAFRGPPAQLSSLQGIPHCHCHVPPVTRTCLWLFSYSSSFSSSSSSSSSSSTRFGLLNHKYPPLQRALLKDDHWLNLLKLHCSAWKLMKKSYQCIHFTSLSSR